MSKNKAKFVYVAGLITAVLLLLTACLGPGNNSDTPAENPAAEPPLPLTGEIFLRCTPACADRGQCGTNADGNNVVLGKGIGPAVINHDLLFPDGATAVIQASSIMDIETIATQTQSKQPFYQVILSDGSKMGWVAGWCVQSQ